MLGILGLNRHGDQVALGSLSSLLEMQKWNKLAGSSQMAPWAFLKSEWKVTFP